MGNKTHKFIKNMYRSGEALHRRLYDLQKHKQDLIEELEATERRIAATNELLQGFHEAAIESQELINGDDE